VTQFDWSVDSLYLQCVTVGNDFFFYDVGKSHLVKGKIKIIVTLDPTGMRDVEWYTWTCKFGYYVQGIFMGSSDPNFVNSTARSNSQKYLITGDDDNYLNIFNYPPIKDNSLAKSY
jgi:hypothetical protein